MPPIILRTARLALRPFDAGDVPAFHEYMSDPDFGRYTSLLPISLEQAQETIDGIVRAQAASDVLPLGFAIALRGEGFLIGNCRLKRDRDDPDQADIAYFLNRRHWGRGYATEATQALINYGFEELGLERIFGLCVPENVPSQRVMEKAGMQAEQAFTFYAEQGHFYRGEFRDLTYLRYAIHRPSWKCRS